MEKIFCKKCRYLTTIPVDGPALIEYRCKKTKACVEHKNPIEFKENFVFCNPYVDNKNNDCKFFEEKKKLLNHLFNWNF